MSRFDPEGTKPPELSGEQARPVWRMWAGRSEQIDELHGEFCDIFGGSLGPFLVRSNGYHGEITEVELIEDPDGRYWGWLEDGEDEPCLIQPHETLYSIQFSNGPQRSEELGLGRTLRLAVREAKLDDPR